MKIITLIAGNNKEGQRESFESLTMTLGEMVTIVGNTGSGKSRLIKDIEELAFGDSITKRKILLDGQEVPLAQRHHLASSYIAHLGQNMGFVMDCSVGEFLLLHQKCRNHPQFSLDETLQLANQITPEQIKPSQHLSTLSGGQTRALMVADIACICDSPIVLVDEIENAGIDKQKAFEALIHKDKLVIAVTHDPHTALMAEKRFVLEKGGIQGVFNKTPEEHQLFMELSVQYQQHLNLQQKIRKAKRFL